MKQVSIFWPAMLIGVFMALCVGYMVHLLYDTPDYSSDLMVRDVAQLVEIFKQIDQDCGILSFDFQKNPINFLNTGSFSGSEVGPMNLAYPRKWRGPYLPDNPTMQATEYQVVRTRDGYFITPGQGVRLPNGKVVGTDLVLDESANIPALMADEQGFKHGEGVFAAPLLGPAAPRPKSRLRTLFGY